MGDIVNLRTVRKRAARQNEEQRAAENRLAFGEKKTEREVRKLRDDQAQRLLDRHRIETGDDR